MSQESDTVTIRTKAEKPRNRLFLEDIELCALPCLPSICLVSTYENKGLQDKAWNNPPPPLGATQAGHSLLWGSESISCHRQFLVAPPETWESFLSLPLPLVSAATMPASI